MPVDAVNDRSPPLPFPRIVRTVTREMVARYRRVNGDHNMIHYDDAAAQAAGYERAVVHGAITGAVLAEACREHFGPAWLTLGRLELIFTAPMYVGETLTTHGRPAESPGGGPAGGGAAAPQGTLEVWCENEQGVRLLVGRARCRSGTS